MTDRTTILCVLCGLSQRERRMLAGRHGHVCFLCIGEAFAAVARTHAAEKRSRTVPAASRKCLLCDRRITATMLVARRDPYFFCAECLEVAFSIALRDGSAPFALVTF